MYCDKAQNGIRICRSKTDKVWWQSVPWATLFFVGVKALRSLEPEAKAPRFVLEGSGRLKLLPSDHIDWPCETLVAWLPTCCQHAVNQKPLQANHCQLDPTLTICFTWDLQDNPSNGAGCTVSKVSLAQHVPHLTNGPVITVITVKSLEHRASIYYVECRMCSLAGSGSNCLVHVCAESVLF